MILGVKVQRALLILWTKECNQSGISLHLHQCSCKDTEPQQVHWACVYAGISAEPKEAPASSWPKRPISRWWWSADWHLSEIASADSPACLFHLELAWHRWLTARLLIIYLALSVWRSEDHLLGRWEEVALSSNIHWPAVLPVRSQNTQSPPANTAQIRTQRQECWYCWTVCEGLWLWKLDTKGRWLFVCPVAGIWFRQTSTAAFEQKKKEKSIGKILKECKCQGVNTGGTIETAFSSLWVWG